MRRPRPPAPAGRERRRRIRALLLGGGAVHLRAAGGGRAGANQSFSPSLRRTERNHSVDAPVPATTSATVATVESIRNVLVGSVPITTARPAASNRKTPAHSQVAPWKKRCRPG